MSTCTVKKHGKQHIDELNEAFGGYRFLVEDMISFIRQVEPGPPNTQSPPSVSLTRTRGV